MTTAKLLLHCPDKPGILAEVRNQRIMVMEKDIRQVFIEL